MKKTILFLGCVMVSLAHAEKFYLAHGWDLLNVTPAEILENADAFSATGISGVSLAIRAKDKAGQPYSFSNMFGDPLWPRSLFTNQIPILQAISRRPGLKHSFLSSFWASSKRLSWQDDTAWNRVASNLATLAWLARQGNLKGLLVDPEDYSTEKQFLRAPSDPPYSLCQKLARKRGAQIMTAIGKEFPDITILSFWLFSMSKADLLATDPLAMTTARQDLWPSFLNGMLDTLPPQALLVDGDEYAYNYKSEKRDFFVAAWHQQNGAMVWIAPENKMKFQTQVHVGFGLYLDMYINGKDSPWYFPPTDGSRLRTLEQNLDQATRVADSYVWLYGERNSWIPWKNIRQSRYADQPTWEKSLPGFPDLLYLLRDAQAAHTHFKRLIQQNPSVTNLVPAGSFHSVKGNKIPTPFWVWQNEKSRQGSITVDPTQGDGDTASVRLCGVENGCLAVTITPVTPGERLLVEYSVKGDYLHGFASWQKGNKWQWQIPCVEIPAREIAGTPWRRASSLVRIPSGVNKMILQFSGKQPINGTGWFDEIRVFRVQKK